MFLTSQQYNWLVTNCPNWMELRWREYTKEWGIGGLRVNGSPAAIENLKCQLP